MKLTTLFRLRKPDGTDPVNIEDFNDNFDVIDEELGKRLESTGAASDMTVAFEQASTRTNLKTGEKISVSFGKIMKWFADLKAVAFSGSYSDLSNQPTIPSGAAADYGVANNDTTNRSDMLATAQVAYQHGQEIDQLNSEIEALNDEGAIKGLEVREGDGVYITYQDGADTVSKKLGSKNFQLGVSCYSASDTSGSFSQYSYSGIDVSDYSKLRIITGTGLNVTVDNTPAQKEGDYYLLNGNSLRFAIQTRPQGAKVEFELLV